MLQELPADRVYWPGPIGMAFDKIVVDRSAKGGIE
jgi:hypothetical protein